MPFFVFRKNARHEVEYDSQINPNHGFSEIIAKIKLAYDLIEEASVANIEVYNGEEYELNN